MNTKVCIWCNEPIKGAYRTIRNVGDFCTQACIDEWDEIRTRVAPIIEDNRRLKRLVTTLRVFYWECDRDKNRVYAHCEYIQFTENTVGMYQHGDLIRSIPIATIIKVEIVER
jgi:hypothetical protein